MQDSVLLFQSNQGTMLPQCFQIGGFLPSCPAKVAQLQHTFAQLVVGQSRDPISVPGRDSLAE